jgi:hypothetical protein
MITAISREPVIRIVSRTTLIHVHRGSEWIGVMLLDEHDRLQRCDPDIPRDIALKALVLHTRQMEQGGTLTRQEDGQSYRWHVAGWEES